MTVTPIATPELEAKLAPLLEAFGALNTEEKLGAIYATLIGLIANLDQYQPLLDKITKKMNGKRFGQ